MVTKKKSEDYISVSGKRKSSTARVRLFEGDGQTVVNGMPIDKYFTGIADDKLWQRPFQVAQAEGKYWATIKVQGGGKSGQLDAVVHGLSRALAKVSEEKRSFLKNQGLLTRDARVRERRKVGTGGKARRKKQSPKR